MTAIEDAVEAVTKIVIDDCKRNRPYKTLNEHIRLAVASGHLIAADDTEGLRAALLRAGALERVGCVTEYLDGKHHCHYDQFTDGKRECRDTHGRITGITVYRFKGERP